jgi:hypothetical protein
MRSFAALILFLSAATHTKGDASFTPDPTAPLHILVGKAPDLPPGSLSADCYGYAVTALGCTIYDYAADRSLLLTAGAEALAGFGSVSGDGQGSGKVFPGRTWYFSSFSDYVEVTGGTGNGTLIAHYELSAGAGQPLNPSLFGNVEVGSPEFTFVNGATRENVYTDLLDAHPDYNQAFNISSPFQFGTPLAFGAETQGTVYYFSTGPDSVNGLVSSMATLTGFTVLDASGNVVGNAQVTPGDLQRVSFFIPEPFSGGLAVLGLIALGCPIALRRSSQSRDSVS